MSVYRTIGPLVPLFYDGNNHLKRQQRNRNKGMVWLVLHMYICSAQSRNWYKSGIDLRKVILTLSDKVRIPTLPDSIPELSVRKVGIKTK